ncbi:MAG TPA: universal stress protein [Mycobacteriales bacterium]|jgi:nucleotide-binding universal stress UspA family protein
MSTDGIGVLVGVDESACSQQALAWAAADAAAKRVPLTIAGVVDLPRLADVPISRELVDAAQLATRQRIDTVAARTHDLTPGVPVRGRVLTGDPAAELLQLAAGADEVVVGSHGTGRFGRLLIGSVGGRVAEHAPCPAVVVRGGDRTDGRVVVGIDTSPHSEPALDYGFAYADAHGVPLVALHVYTIGAFVYPVMPYPTPPYPVVEEMERFRAEALRTAEHTLGKWTEKYPDVDVRIEVTEGPAARELVNSTRSAGLLVVGTRGHGGLAGMLLGSVSHAVLRHAFCPVAIAR